MKYSKINMIRTYNESLYVKMRGIKGVVMKEKELEQLDFFKDSKEEVKKEIEALRKEIEYHNQLYYEQDNPELTDAEYDKLTQRLKLLEKQNPELITKDSPTQKVGGKVKAGFAEVRHDVQMQSLQDVFTYGDIEEFVEKVEQEYGKDTEFTVETKIDGLSVSLEYVDGKLVRGSTRGDGFVGEDVTENLKTIESIPHELKSKDTIEIRGEVYLPRKEFEMINEELIAKGKNPLANPRNAAAGTLRQLDAELVRQRKLSIFVFNVQKGMNFKTHSESLNYLKSVGVKTIEYMKVCVGKEQVLNAITEIGLLRDSLAYDIDGAVVKVNDLALRVEMGSTVKVPKWAIAYKYPPEQKETKVKDIILQVGRTGQVTPVAIFDPVRLAGSVIAKTTLHNFDFIAQKDIRIKDTVLIEKAGDVIPEVVRVLTEKRTGEEIKYLPPLLCPVCGEKLEKEEETVALRCTNSECPALLYRTIVHFASRDCMDIVGLGENIVDQLIDQKLVKDVADLYYLTYEDIVHLERFAPKSAEKLIQAISATKQNGLDQLIFGLGIRHIGKKAAKILASHYEDIYEKKKKKAEELNELDDFGMIMATSVEEFFKKPQTLEIIEKLDQAGVNLKGNKIKKDSEKLKDQIFVITGSFEEYSRNELSDLIEKNSGKVSGTVSKKTSYVVVGEDAGSKLKKAETLGIPIIGIEELLRMIEE